MQFRDFPGGPVVRTLPSRVGVEGLIPGWGTKIPHALSPKRKRKNPKHNYTCTPVADSCWCMAKPIQYCKVKLKKEKRNSTIANSVKNLKIKWSISKQKS